MDTCLFQFAIIGVGLGIGAVCKIFGQLPDINEEQVFNSATATLIQSHITTIIQPATTVFRPTATVTATETVTRTVVSYQERKPRADYAHYLVDLMVPRIVEQFSMWAAFLIIAGSVLLFSFSMCEKIYYRNFGNNDKTDKGPRKGDGPPDIDVKADPNQVTTSKQIKPRTNATAEGQSPRKGVQPTQVKGQAHQSKTDSSENVQSPHTEFDESTNPFGAVQDDLFAKMSDRESFDHAELVKEIELRGGTNYMVNPKDRQALDEQADTVEKFISNEPISTQQPAQSAADDISPPSPSISFVSDFEAALQNEESTSTPLEQVTNTTGADNAIQTASDKASPVQEDITSKATEEGTDSISQQITNKLLDDIDATNDEVSSIASETFVDATGPEDIAIEISESPTKPSEVTRESVQPSDVEPEEHADGLSQEQKDVEDSSTEFQEEPREEVQSSEVESSDVEPEERAGESKQAQEQAEISPNDLPEELQEDPESLEAKTEDQATGLEQEKHRTEDSHAAPSAEPREDVQSPDIEPEEQTSESKPEEEHAEASYEQPLKPPPPKAIRSHLSEKR